MVVVDEQLCFIFIIAISIEGRNHIVVSHLIQSPSKLMGPSVSSEVRVTGDRGKAVKKQGAHETAVTQQSAKHEGRTELHFLPRLIHKRENRFPFPHEHHPRDRNGCTSAHARRKPDI
ncbi:hypothetical protein TNCT_174751 [Trichonephila clavata]|uniref:Uncharacterized protein n=1 Tax=Trichonephila clavata TaxID=2740835 RepID=A0A8X6EZT5_TRICU|nr:hypothetical protein TNCT_174751 [Trichonephila clavata]